MFLRTYQSRLFFFAFLLLVFLIATQFYSYINTEQVVLQEAERSLERTAQLFNAHLIAERQELKRFVTFVRDDNRIQEYVFIITKFDSGREELSKKYKKLYGWLPTDRTLILGSIDQIIYGDKNVDLLKVLSKYKNSIKIHSFYFHGHQGLELVTIAPIFHKGNIIGRIVLTRILNNQWLQGKRKTGVGHVLIEKDNVILRSTFENLQSKEFNPSDSRLIIEGNVFRLYSIDLEGTDSYSPHLWFATSETAVLNQLKEQLNKALYQVVAGILAIILLGWFFSRNFRKPLAQLSLLTKEISDGNLPNIKKLDAHNEIEILNNQFIDMIQVLREKNAQIVEAHKELEKSAITDALTGLHNRRYFEKKLIKVLENCNVGTKECALCYFDLDQFKIVNDSCGHEAGDELLCQLTSILDTRVRGTDVLARLGGDEFGLILTDINEDQSISVAEDIKKLISEYQFVWEDKIFTVGVSIGIIAINSKSKDVADIMRKADIACYTAKHEGRNRVHYYREMDIHTNTLTVEIDWIHKLQDALRNNRFELWFQSIAKTDYSENNNHIEILLRLKDEEDKIILPNNFIPAAERYQLMPQIDRWVISNMFSLLQKTDHYLQNTLFSINLSGLSLTDSTLFDFIKNEFKEKNIDPSIICFEITETAAIRKLSSAISLVSQLRELDCKFALDDFGAGLTSFKHLKYLPVDFIKIDGSFVSKIVDDPIDEGMVEAINKVAQLMRKETIAEYVENQEIRNKLVGLGVDYIQGYLIDKPRPINEYFSVKMKKTIQLVSV